MFQLREALKIATEDYRNGLITYREYIGKVVLIIAESQQTVEVAGWLADAITDRIDFDEAQGT